jgi:hypothetical protein
VYFATITNINEVAADSRPSHSVKDEGISPKSLALWREDEFVRLERQPGPEHS